MTSGQITAGDIKNWDSLDDIAKSFEKRGLEPQPELSEDNRLVLELADGEFIELCSVESAEGVGFPSLWSEQQLPRIANRSDFLNCGSELSGLS